MRNKILAFSLAFIIPFLVMCNDVYCSTVYQINATYHYTYKNIDRTSWGYANDYYGGFYQQLTGQVSLFRENATPYWVYYPNGIDIYVYDTNHYYSNEKYVTLKFYYFPCASSDGINFSPMSSYISYNCVHAFVELPFELISQVGYYENLIIAHSVTNGSQINCVFSDIEEVPLFPHYIGVKVGSLLVSKNSISTTVNLDEWEPNDGRPTWSTEHDGEGHRINNVRPTGNIRVTTPTGQIYDTPVTYINPTVTYNDNTATITFDPTYVCDYHNETNIDIASVTYNINYEIYNIEEGDTITQNYIYNYTYGDNIVNYYYYDSDNNPVEFTGEPSDDTTITERPNSTDIQNSNGVLSTLVDTIVGFIANAVNSLLGGLLSVFSQFTEVIGSLGNIFEDFGGIVGVVMGGTIGQVVFLGFLATLIMIILKR